MASSRFEMSSSLPSPLGDAAIADDDDDAFLGLVEYARSMLFSEDDDSDAAAAGVGDPPAPPWSWVVSRILKTCVAYPSGVTSAILLSDLFQVDPFPFSLSFILDSPHSDFVWFDFLVFSLRFCGNLAWKRK